jgi:hypothetical protein
LEGGDELALTQSFDLGFWGRSLFFAGYSWDWLRRVDGESFPKVGAVRLGLGGVYEHRVAEERFNRADWLIALSYELPHSMEELSLDTIFTTNFNLGLESQFRLGSIALLEASIAKRQDQKAEAEYASLLRWAVGLGLRLPAPFTFGIEYFGDVVFADGGLGDPSGFEGGRFRFYLGYSI